MRKFILLGASALVQIILANRLTFPSVMEGDQFDFHHNTDPTTNLAIACSIPGVHPLDRYKTECFFAQNQLDIYINEGIFALTDEDLDKCQLIQPNMHTHSASNSNIEQFFTSFTLQEGCQIFLQETMLGDRADDEDSSRNPLDITNHYGCFCSFGVNMDFGKGKPQNELDQICRNSYHNYYCMKESDPECVNFDTYYIATIRKERWEMESDCDLFNEALQSRYEWTDEQLECARNRCLIDSEFTISALGLVFTSGFQFDNSYLWPEQGGTFDRERECRANGGRNLENASVCCGEYPDRAPRDTNFWACCGSDMGNPYKPAFDECCADGSVHNIGLC